MTVAVRELAVNELDLISGGADSIIDAAFFGFGVRIVKEGNQTCVDVIGADGPESIDGRCVVPKGRPA
jgi:hypothetical protein